MYKGTKFNSKKETVRGEEYLGIRIYRFYMKCSRCKAEYVLFIFSSFISNNLPDLPSRQTQRTVIMLVSVAFPVTLSRGVPEKKKRKTQKKREKKKKKEML